MTTALNSTRENIISDGRTSNTSATHPASHQASERPREVAVQLARTAAEGGINRRCTAAAGEYVPYEPEPHWTESPAPLETPATVPSIG